MRVATSLLILALAVEGAQERLIDPVEDAFARLFVSQASAPTLRAISEPRFVEIGELPALMLNDPVEEKQQDPGKTRTRGRRPRSSGVHALRRSGMFKKPRQTQREQMSILNAMIQHSQRQDPTPQFSMENETEST